MYSAIPYWVWTFLAAAALLGTAAQPSHAQMLFEPAPESTFWIEGSSTLNAFTCEVPDVDGYGRLSLDNVRTVSLADVAAADEAIRAEVVVSVDQFDCGKERMNADLYEALQADRHPTITFRFDRAEMLGPDDSADDWSRIRVYGRLTVAGTERAVAFEGRGRWLAPRTVQVQGSTPLLMSDFGVEPPRALWGLVKAHDRIEVHFDLVAEEQPAAPRDGFEECMIADRAC